MALHIPEHVRVKELAVAPRTLISQATIGSPIICLMLLSVSPQEAQLQTGTQGCPKHALSDHPECLL